ncbi:insulin-like growth factor 2 mRNA-binding protein 1 isoform X2 [Asparagus officinalis]|uniref:insulin-like growth factor 2 mRNA-binding protein 1 isoform X2 n=1 Tax=Asparagus officinalis TaxID=4686 RepID=UPI00098DE76C|nr:insulin-like growth factor 2 mRNA-binding protein 1 isoform X2 [Asparagus officinalis]
MPDRCRFGDAETEHPLPPASTRYLIVRNVPALGCGEQLSNLFGSYGNVEECKPMDTEDCEPFTDVFWIKFSQVSSARFAKRKLDESVFYGNRLQVSYAPQFETLSDTKEKLEGRRNEVLGRLKHGKGQGSKSLSQVAHHPHNRADTYQCGQASPMLRHQEFQNFNHNREYNTSADQSGCIGHVSSDKEYFPSSSMNQTVQLVREKLDKIKSSADNVEAGPASKRTRLDSRRRI